MSNTSSCGARLTVDLSPEPIDLAAVLAQQADDRHGAHSIFVGTVRNHDPQADGERVVAIDYSAHPHAQEILAAAVSELIDNLLDTPHACATVVHRIGRVLLGEPALLVVVSTPHRNPGLDTVAPLVERIKEVAPIWKQQILEDGRQLWSNLP